MSSTSLRLTFKGTTLKSRVIDFRTALIGTLISTKRVLMLAISPTVSLARKSRDSRRKRVGIMETERPK